MSDDSMISGRSQGLPPLSNTGVTDFSYGSNSGLWCGLDYLTATFHGELSQPVVMSGSPLEVRKQCEKSVKGNYTRQWELYPAGLLFHNPDELRQGWHVELKGSDLRVLRAAGVSDAAVLSWLLNHPGLMNIPRADVALDFLDMSAPVSALRAAYESGKMKTRLVDKWIDSLSPDGARAWSLYLGAPKSDKRLVIYDKAKERKAKEQVITNPEWTRIELRVKGRVAMAAMNGVLKHGALEVVKDMAMRTVEFEGSWWAEKLAAADGTRRVEPVERKLTDTAAWVERTALPGVLHYLWENYDEELFVSAWMGFINLAAQKYKRRVVAEQEIQDAIRKADLL